MNMQTEPAVAAVGEKIEHDLMPGFVMEVRGTAPCEEDFARPTPHSKYLVTDPEGNDDELCAYDVHKRMGPLHPLDLS